MTRATLRQACATAAAFSAVTALVLAASPPAVAAGARNATARDVVVHSALGGEIFGYDVDQNGTEGVLTESLTLNGQGVTDTAIETFDQKTGKILKIVKEQKNTYNEYVTIGIAGTSVGLVEFEHDKGLGDPISKRSYITLDPLDANQITGSWTPGLKTDQIILGLSGNQGSPNAAVFAFKSVLHPLFQSFVFGTDVANNVSGPFIQLTDGVFSESNSPVMALDGGTNVAVVASSPQGGCRTCVPQLALVDLTKGTVGEFTGLGLGTVNGIAVDSADGIACTATEIDFSLEFYNLATQTGFTVLMPNATAQVESGADVEFDPVNKLFLVGQPFSSTAPNTSSIQVFDKDGNFVESINGLSLPSSPVRLALNPNRRTGFVEVTPFDRLQSFSY